MGLGDVVDGIIELYRTRARLVLGIGAVLQGPVFIIDLILGARMVDQFSGMLGFDVLDPPVPLPTTLPPLDPEAVWGFLGIAGAMVLIATVAGGLTTAALAVAIGEMRLGRRPTLRGVFSRVLRRLGALVATMLTVVVVMTAGVVGGLLLVATTVSLAPDPAAGGLPVFLGLVAAVGVAVLLAFLGLRWALWPQVVLLEGGARLTALGRSFRLVAGSTFRILGYVLAFGLATGVLSQLLGQLGGIVVGLVTGPAGTPGTLLRLIWAAAITILMAPVVPAAMTLLYFDLRLRRGEPAPTD
jgi:hypothetical protein